MRQKPITPKLYSKKLLNIDLRNTNKAILAIAIPAIVSNITTPLLGLIDVAIVGHIGSATYIGAIAVGSTMFNMLYWLFGFLRMGTAGLTSQSCGAGDFHASSASLRRALLMAFTIAVLLITMSKPIGLITLNFLDADDFTAPPAQLYFSIAIFGAPAALGMYALNGWLLGMQNTRIPMLIALLTNVVNIAISASLVFGLGMKIDGVAIGTLSAQWIGFITAIIVVRQKYRPEKVAIAELTKRRALGRLFKINLDIFLRTLCLVAVTAWFTRAGASQSVNILAANALLMQLFMFFSYFSDGFAYAGEALAGKHYGAGNRDGLKHTVSALMNWGLWIALGFTALYFFGGKTVIKLLTDENDVIDTALKYLPWAVSVPLCGIAAFIYDGVFVGLTQTRRMLVSVASGMAVFFIIYFSLSPTLGNHALWLAFVTYLAVRGITLHLLIKHS